VRARPAGFTLVEMMVVVGILGVLAAVLARVQSQTGKDLNKTKASVDMQSEALSILNRLRVPLSQAGGDVINMPPPSTQSVFAEMDGQQSPWIIFFEIDCGSDAGMIDSLDQWRRIRADNGFIIEETFNNAAGWDAIKNNTATLLTTKRWAPLNPSIKIERLNFDLYDSEHKRIQKGYAASFVRIELHLSKNSVTVNKSDFVFLRSLVYGPA
jgi:prepilin-type N-terminal cleavage/methylation domain-containing protein